MTDSPSYAVFRLISGFFVIIILFLLVAAGVAIAVPMSFVVVLAPAPWTGAVRSFRASGSGDDDDADAGAMPGEAEAEHDPARPGAARTARAGSMRMGRRSHQDDEVAELSYYAGPILADAVATIRAVWGASDAVAALGKRWVDLVEKGDGSYWRPVVTAAVGLGLPIGLFAGWVGVVVLSLVYAAVSVAALTVAALAGLLLWALDSAMRFVWGVASTCPACGAHVRPYPHYRCPGCAVLHRDIRPGELGVLRRVCRCGARFPTMLLTGAGNLEGVCPACQSDLHPRFGRDAEIVVPLVGATNAGKTRLMEILASLLSDWVHDEGGRVQPVGDARQRLDVIRDAVRDTSHTEKTLATRPRGLALQIEIRSHRRSVYFFDAAGELFLREESLADMQHLNKAGTWIQVVDPLSARGLWSRLSPEDQARLEPLRSGDGAAAEVYQRTLNQLLRMKPRKRPSRLAFVVTKTDLLRSVGCDIGATSQEIKAWVSADDGLDLGDIVRGADQRFAEVRYFGTGAVAADAQPDAGAVRLLRWILANDDIRFEEQRP